MDDTNAAVVPSPVNWSGRNFPENRHGCVTISGVASVQLQCGKNETVGQSADLPLTEKFIRRCGSHLSGKPDIQFTDFLSQGVAIEAE